MEINVDNSLVLQNILGPQVSIYGDMETRAAFARMVTHDLLSGVPCASLIGFKQDTLQAAFPTLMPAAMAALAVVPPPAYDPAAWVSIQKESNCYAYALDHKLGGTPQPGVATGKSWVDECPIVNRASVMHAAIRDGLIPTGTNLEVLAGHYNVALFVSDGRDFHWCRQDADGTWSHKDGEHPVKPVVDENGHGVSGVGIKNVTFKTAPVVVDGSLIQYPPYTLAGFFHVPNTGLTVGEQAPHVPAAAPRGWGIAPPKDRPVIGRRERLTF